ncbi:hypothetical protein TcasGA2_TC034502 [Tribolium castaneum]|uniref:Uncharacterized protein n=1 Tax=Tribolium castaneum TaxID=7070 RepID=A0A139W9R7_TRICA|nr:hypothetical protein TcasGA2_TC034502 [Tribolium castaneum]
MDNYATRHGRIIGPDPTRYGIGDKSGKTTTTRRGWNHNNGGGKTANAIDWGTWCRDLLPWRRLKALDKVLRLLYCCWLSIFNKI